MLCAVCSTLRLSTKQLSMILLVILLYFLVPTVVSTYLLSRNSTECAQNKGAEAVFVMDYINNAYRHKRVRPSLNATGVLIEIHVQDISELNETTGDFVLDLFFSQIWVDPELNFSGIAHCRQNVTLDPSYLSKIWTPNICLINAKQTEVHKSPTVNMFVILYDDGTLWINYRMQVKAPCEVDLRAFPFDSQYCYLVFESVDYDIHKVRLAWLQSINQEVNPVTLTMKNELPDFTLGNFVVSNSTTDTPQGVKHTLSVEFKFIRRSGFYILQAYVPTYFTILVSWTAFVMDPRALPARTTVGISSLLALTFQLGNILSNLPRVSYTKAIDVWILGCVSFLFGTIVELAVVSSIKLYQSKRDHKEEKLRRKMKIRTVQSCEGLGSQHLNLARDPDPCLLLDPSELQCGACASDEHIGIPLATLPLIKRFGKATLNVENIDNFSLYFFPTCFIIFNVAYYHHYLYSSQYDRVK